MVFAYKSEDEARVISVSPVEGRDCYFRDVVLRVHVVAGVMGVAAEDEARLNKREDVICFSGINDFIVYLVGVIVDTVRAELLCIGFKGFCVEYKLSLIHI